MNPELHTPPIFVLQDDILLHIFHLNTYVLETEVGACQTFRLASYRPIVVARFTSQVCRFWRQVILGSPTIWGSLIDMTIADTESDEWAKEVMKRVGRAPLSIYGVVGHSARSRWFFTSLLANHWDRIRRLDVRLDDNAGLIDVSTWNILWDRPAPNMQKFLLAFDPKSLTALSETKNGPLFFDHAPSLRRFHCGKLSRHIGPKLSWISQLASLTLSHSLAVIDVLRILSQTVQLESLVITNTILDVGVAAMDWSEQIHLPNLIRIDTRGASVRGSFRCLKHIMPKPGCALLFDPHRYYVQNELIVGATEQPDIMSDLKILIRYIVSYFNLQLPEPTTSPCLCLGAYRVLDVTLGYEPGTHVDYFGHPKFSLRLRFEEAVFNTTTTIAMHEIFGAISSSFLERMQLLSLDIGRRTWIIPENPHLHKFLLSLSSVHTIYLTAYAVRTMNDIFLHYINAPVLPSLIQINLVGEPDELCRHTEDVHMLLERRKAAHMPVSRLHVWKFLFILDRDEWRFLDRLEGLIVSWISDSGEIAEYVCGSGERDSERLRSLKHNEIGYTESNMHSELPTAVEQCHDRRF